MNLCSRTTHPDISFLDSCFCSDVMSTNRITVRILEKAHTNHWYGKIVVSGGIPQEIVTLLLEVFTRPHENSKCKK